MAGFVSTKAYVMINAVDLSDHAKSITFTYNPDMLDSAAMGDVGKPKTKGLEDGALVVEFYQDYADSKVDATLFPLVGAAAFACKVRADSGAIAATNPEYQFDAQLDGGYSPITATHGQMSTVSVTFNVKTAVTRDVQA
jgi:hypothetical protein